MATYTVITNTPELLVLTLSFLPQQDLLCRAQLVCQAWRSIVQTTPVLQRVLDFRSVPASDGRVLTSTLAKHFPPWFRDLRIVPDLRCYSGETFCKLPWACPPLDPSFSLPRFNAKEASWRNMLVCQPALTSVEVVRFVHAMRGDFESSLVIPCPDGVRMGMLYDLIESWANEQGNRWAVRWDCLSDEEVGLEGQYDEKWQRRDCVTVLFQYTRSCVRGPVKPPTKSEGFTSLGREMISSSLEFGKAVDVGRGKYTTGRYSRRLKTRES